MKTSRSIPSAHKLNQFPHQKLNTLSRRRRPRSLRESVNSREVRHSLTWHSSESESARGRFEPVAVVKLRLDGSLAMFAPEGDGCLKKAEWEDAGRIHKAGTTLYDFWYFSSLKSTRKEKLLYVSSRANNVRPLSRRRQHTCFAYVLIPLQAKAQSIANRQSKKYILHSVSARTPPTPAHLFFSGRAGNACTNLLGFFVYCVRTRGNM